MILAIVALLAQSFLSDIVPQQTAAPTGAVSSVVVSSEPSAPARVEATVEAVVPPQVSVVKASSAACDATNAVPRQVKISSLRTDYDRKEGVILFDGNVFVDDPDYKMHASKLYVFLDGTNDLKRIVAIGNVAITNDLRVGTCAKAAYTKSAGKIVMYGDGAEVKAVLTDNSKRKSQVEGSKITFWTDSEQVEVVGSTVTLDSTGIGGKEGAQKLLGR